MPIKRSFYEVASFVRHLRSYYRLHVRNVARLYTSDLPGNAIFLDRGTYIVPPLSSSVTHAVWTHHTNYSDGAAENKIFQTLREGCSTFLDLGAAEGYYSAFFAATATRPSRLVAIDLSPDMCRWHTEVIASVTGLSRHPVDWTVHQVAVTDAESETTLGEGFSKDLVCWYDADPGRPVRTTTLANLLKSLELTPDLIKVDIESYEYEVLTSSLDYLAKHRPKIHLELHSEMMRNRGKSPQELMGRLLEHYRIIGSVPPNYHNAPITRMGLVPKAAA